MLAALILVMAGTSGAGGRATTAPPPPAAAPLESRCTAAALGQLGRAAIVLGPKESKPKALRRPSPNYPDRAFTLGGNCVFLAELLIDESGTPKDVWVARDPAGPSHDCDLWQEEVEKALRLWRCEPLMVAGAAVPACVPERFEFTMLKTNP